MLSSLWKIYLLAHVILTLGDGTSNPNCIPIANRQGIDVYDWKDVEYGICSLDLSRPLIILNSPIAHWSKSQRRDILNSMDRFEISVVQQSSYCDCFEDIDLELCKQLTQSFAYYSSRLSSMLHMQSRSDSFWYPHQKDQRWIEQYMQCIHRSTKLMTVADTMKKLKSAHKYQQKIQAYIEKHNGSVSPDEHIKYTAIQCPFGMSLQGADRVHYDSMLRIKNMAPFFKPFAAILKDTNDISMLNVWIGSSGYKTTTHFDKTDLLYFVLNGNKTFLLSPASLFGGEFTLFPFMDINQRNSMWYDRTLYERHNTDVLAVESKFKYKVNLYKHEVFFLPAFWFHQVINGKYSTFAINLWTVNQLSTNVVAYLFSDDIKQRFLLNVNTENWKVIVYYFLHNLLHGFGDFGLMFAYFSRLYPVLDDIQKYHGMLAANMYAENEWLDWFVDFEHMLMCYGEDRYRLQLFEGMLKKRQNSVTCPVMDDYAEWDREIQSILYHVQKVEEGRSREVAQIELAEFVEKILFTVTSDVMFHPLIIALHCL